jgi:hypothetical protein
MIQELAERKTIIILTGTAFPMLFFVLSRFHNGWLYLVPSAVGPMVSALFFMLRAFNPYQSLYASIEGVEGADARGDAAHRLVMLLKSRKAKHVLLRTGVLVSASLCIIALGTSIVMPGALKWSFDAGAVLFFTLVFAIFSSSFHYHCLLRWAFRSWTGPDPTGAGEPPASGRRILKK